ncbi:MULTISPECIES: C40 family peptidase [unclassified Streptomyces]|uniref:C40 family peptidase n=1 Tax=unclassified Streptomyces TaxID=2593676 RepID=UPI002E24D64D|nr:NlpC/P60 family protein [Streptomyces sp. NBC_01023]
MASHRRPKQPSRARVTVLTATAAAAVALTAQAAHAEPKPTKSEVKAKVDKLNEDVDAASQKYDGAKEQEGKLKKQARDLQDSVARGQGELNKLRDQLGSIASAQYRSGGIDPSVQLFLSSDPDNFLDKATAQDQLSAEQTDALKKIQDKQRTLAQQRAEAQDKLKDLSSTRKKLAEDKQKIQSKLAQAQKLLQSLTAAEQASITADNSRANRDSSRADLGNDVPASARGGAALNAAKTQIGKPYQYSATGMASWDCSGLTQWAYSQAGVSLPRTSQTQANAGQRIYSASALKPGDLVLFYGDLHHIGLYAGNGMVLHAPHTGANVRYEAMGNMPFQFGVRI